MLGEQIRPEKGWGDMRAGLLILSSIQRALISSGQRKRLSAS